MVEGALRSIARPAIRREFNPLLAEVARSAIYGLEDTARGGRVNRRGEAGLIAIAETWTSRGRCWRVSARRAVDALEDPSPSVRHRSSRAPKLTASA